MVQHSTFSLGTCVLVAGLVLLACAATTGQPGVAAKPALPAPPSPGVDVPRDWWSAVQKDIAQSEYNITWQDHAALDGLGAAWQAPNRAQGLRTYFTTAGPRVVRRTEGVGDWTWGLELVEFGGAERITAPTPPHDTCVDGNRITFERDELAEWYVNSATGLEQGFTIYQAPEAGGEMVLRMAVRGDVSANMMQDGQTVEFTSPGGVRVMRYGKFRVSDAIGRPLAATMTVTDGNVIELRTSADGAAFPLMIDPLTTSAEWIAEGDQDHAYFGCSVSTAGDVNGDGYSDVIVGASGYDGGGRVCVYYGSATGLPAAASWTLNGDPKVGVRIGYPVSTAGDVNGDGYSDVIIGAPDYGYGVSSGSGRVFVYYGSASGLSATANWWAYGKQVEFFGDSVSTAGDVNGDGYSDVIIGARLHGSSQSEGRAYVYYGSASGLSATPNWTADGDQPNGYFGVSVSTAGDVNGDGYSDVIVGASGYDGSQGRVFVYHGSASGLSATPNWTADGDQPNAYFGGCATAGDVNGDGYSDVIVRAWGYDNGLAKAGRVFVYHGSASRLSATPAWTADGGQANAYFGSSVSMAGDVNGDGYDDIIVGAPHYSNGQSYAGRVHVYHGYASPITGSILINNNRPVTNNPVVTLALAWAGGDGGGMARMRFSDDGSHWTTWEPVAATRSHTLPRGDGRKTVRVQYQDKLSKRSAVFSDYILLDTTAPTGTIIINGGAATTKTRSITLGLTWADGTGAGVTRMRFSDDGTHWSYWTSPEASHKYTLPAGLGYHTVRVQYLDGANNYSAVYNDYIKLAVP